MACGTPTSLVPQRVREAVGPNSSREPATRSKLLIPLHLSSRFYLAGPRFPPRNPTITSEQDSAWLGDASRVLSTILGGILAARR